MHTAGGDKPPFIANEGANYPVSQHLPVLDARQVRERELSRVERARITARSDKHLLVSYEHGRVAFDGLGDAGLESRLGSWAGACDRDRAEKIASARDRQWEVHGPAALIEAGDRFV